MGPSTPTRPNIDIDMLWNMEENQNEGIKSDLDNFSKKSLQDVKNDHSEDRKLKDIQDDDLNRLQEDLKNQEEQIDSTGKPRKDKKIGYSWPPSGSPEIFLSFLGFPVESICSS